MEISEEVGRWFDGGRDFAAGIAILRRVSRNTFYINNLERSKRGKTLEYELGKFKVQGLKFKVQSSKFKVQSRQEPPRPEGHLSLKKEGKLALQDKLPITNNRLPITNNQQPIRNNQQPASGRKPLVLRDEFPFLGEMGCPEELKVLVADMITAHDKYIRGHAMLFEVAHKGEKACFAAASQTVENYLENRMIWDELEHYQKTGLLLGKHPIFEKKRKEKELLGLTEKQLTVRIANLKRQIKYRNDLLADPKSEDETYQRTEELRTLKEEMKFLTNRLNEYAKRKKRV